MAAHKYKCEDSFVFLLKVWYENYLWVYNMQLIYLNGLYLFVIVITVHLQKCSFSFDMILLNYILLKL